MEVYGEYQTTLFKALTEIDRNWKKYDGLIVAGTHNPQKYDVEKIIEKIKEARERGRPSLFICWGFQLCAIEFARNVGGISDATSEEWGQGTFVVRKRERLNVGLRDGESYWNNYYVNLPEWKVPKNFFAVQYHPEYQSSIDRPHPLLTEFLIYAKERHKMAV